ncbi:hypothetical protein F5146DRAFT_128716 [Armillaria mellea]|nr:hypothetical protein F5146DRAFT_128716 [Armillaria mellea]
MERWLMPCTDEYQIVVSSADPEQGNFSSSFLTVVLVLDAVIVGFAKEISSYPCSLFPLGVLWLFHTMRSSVLEVSRALLYLRRQYLEGLFTYRPLVAQYHIHPPSMHIQCKFMQKLQVGRFVTSFLILADYHSSCFVVWFVLLFNDWHPNTAVPEPTEQKHLCTASPKGSTAICLFSTLLHTSWLPVTYATFHIPKAVHQSNNHQMGTNVPPL